MADFNSAIMTVGGAALLAATIAGTARIKFVKLVTGSGDYTEPEKDRGKLQTCINLKVPVQEIPFSSISMASETCVKLVALVSNEELDVGYYINEIGIFAVNELDVEAEPILYSIAVAKVADYLPPYNGMTPSTITQEYFATVDNALAVTIQTNTGAVALASDLAALSERVEKLLGCAGGEPGFVEGLDAKDVVDAINKVFLLGSENKQKLVDNLIAMGIDASTDDTWGTLLDKVLDMTDTSGDTVTAEALLTGYTAHNAAGEQITGAIPELAGVTVDATKTTQDDAYTYFNMPPGHYDANSKVRSANSNLKPVYKTETKTTNIAFNSNEANVKRSGTAYFSGKVLGVTSIYCPDNNSPIASISISGNAVTITLLFKGTSSWTYSVSVTANIA